MLARGERMKNVPWRYPFFGETLADEARQQLHGVRPKNTEDDESTTEQMNEHPVAVNMIAKIIQDVNRKNRFRGIIYKNKEQK